MKKKNGFTLIELLAVIIVLAIIALIAMPIIFNVIENAKLKALENSTYGVIDAVRMNYMENLMNSEDGTVTLTGSVTTLTLSGEHPIAGNWEIKNSAEVTENRGIAVTGVKFASMNEYTCTNVKNNVIQNKVECTKDESSVQPVTKVTFTLNGTSYEVDENTSWTTFLQTNTDYEVSGENVVLKGTTRKVLLNGTAIDKDSTITAGTYTLEEETTVSITLAVDADGDGVAELGDEVCIGNECFYVLTNDGTNIKMLAKYRIDVSYNTTRKNRLQSPSGGGPLTTVFSSETIHGTNYNSYEGSIVEDLVGDYKTTLEGLGATISGATLLSYDEITAAPFNCQNGVMNSCDPTYSWLYKDGNTTGYIHWTRSANSSNTNNAWIVNSYGFVDNYDYSSTFGVRPVVTISTSSI